MQLTKIVREKVTKTRRSYYNMASAKRPDQQYMGLYKPHDTPIGLSTFAGLTGMSNKWTDRETDHGTRDAGNSGPHLTRTVRVIYTHCDSCRTCS